jgi:hypothetical protein
MKRSRHLLCALHIITPHKQALQTSYLELLVGIVNTQLLEGVQLEDFEAEDIENTDRVRRLGGALQRAVHLNIILPPRSRVSYHKTNSSKQGIKR